MIQQKCNNELFSHPSPKTTKWRISQMERLPYLFWCFRSYFALLSCVWMCVFRGMCPTRAQLWQMTITNSQQACRKQEELLDGKQGLRVSASQQEVQGEADSFVSLPVLMRSLGSNRLVFSRTMTIFKC